MFQLVSHVCTSDRRTVWCSNLGIIESSKNICVHSHEFHLRVICKHVFILRYRSQKRVLHMT